MRPAFTRFLAAACRSRGMSCVSLRLPAAFEPVDGRLRIDERSANDDRAHRDCSHAISAYSIAMVRSARTSTVRSASRAQSSGVVFVAMPSLCSAGSANENERFVGVRMGAKWTQ